MKVLRYSTPLSLSCLVFNSAFAVENIELSPGNFVSPEAEISVLADVIPVSGNTVTNYSAKLTPNTAYFGRMGGLTFFRATDTPNVNSVIDSTSAGFYQTQVPGSNTYQAGAQQGTDNWVYITNIDDKVAWAQVDIQENIVSPPERFQTAAGRQTGFEIKVVQFSKFSWIDPVQMLLEPPNPKCGQARALQRPSVGKSIPLPGPWLTTRPAHDQCELIGPADEQIGKAAARPIP